MRDHKSILAWQEARSVTIEAVTLGKRFWKPYASALFSQLQRSALSVQLNIAEGYAYGPGKRMIHHWRIAYGSAVEAGELLELLRDTDLIPRIVISGLLEQNRRCQRLLLGLLKRNNPF